MALEQTFALIKSDAIARGDKWRILAAIEQAGFRITRMALMVPFPKGAAAELYAAHAGRPYYDSLITSVTGPAGTIALCLEREDAVAAWRATMGATDPTVAAPGTMRAVFGGKAMPDNAVHGSDSKEAAKAEARIAFSWGAEPTSYDQTPTLATIYFDDWRVYEHEREASPLPGYLRISRNAYGLAIEANMPDGLPTQSIGLECNHGALHLTVFGESQDEPLVDIHVDSRGAHAEGHSKHSNQGTGRTVLFDGNRNNTLYDDAWQPMPGPEFNDWVKPHLNGVENGYGIYLINNARANLYQMSDLPNGYRKVFETLAAAQAFARTLDAGPRRVSEDAAS